MRSCISSLLRVNRVTTHIVQTFFSEVLNWITAKYRGDSFFHTKLTFERVRQQVARTSLLTTPVHNLPLIPDYFRKLFKIWLTLTKPLCSCTVSECWQYQYYYLWCRGIRKSEAKRWKCDSKQNSKLNKLRKWLRELKFKIRTKPEFKHPMSSVTNRLLSRKINLKAIAFTVSNTHLIFVSCSFSNFCAVSSLSTISISFSSVNLTKVSLRASRSAATDSTWDLKRKISYLTILQLSVLKKKKLKFLTGGANNIYDILIFSYTIDKANQESRCSSIKGISRITVYPTILFSPASHKAQSNSAIIF